MQRNIDELEQKLTKAETALQESMNNQNNDPGIKEEEKQAWEEERNQINDHVE